MTACASQGRDCVLCCAARKDHLQSGTGSEPLGCSFGLIPLSTGSWRLEILFYSSNCVIEDIMYTDAVAVPTGYFRGVPAKRDRLSGVSLRRHSWEPSHAHARTRPSRGMTFGRLPRRLPPSAIFAVAHAFRPSGHICHVHSVSSPGRGWKTAHQSGQGTTRPPEEHNSATSDRYWGPCRPSGL